GSVLIATGMAAVAVGALWPGRSAVLQTLGMVVIGVGMGWASLSQILSMQSSVAWGRRGAATGAVIFFRTMGGSLCVGILGAWLSFTLAGRLATPAGSGIDVTAALRPETHRLLTQDQLRVVQAALGLSLREVFLQMAALAVLAIVCSAGLRGGRAV